MNTEPILSFHSILVQIVNGAALGIGINASMIAFFGTIRKIIGLYNNWKDKNAITNVQK